MTNMNQNPKTVEGFGEEWAFFQQDQLSDSEFELLCQRYFSIFPWESLPVTAQGFDMGSGSGRFAFYVAKRVGKLFCIDASQKALEVAQSRLSKLSNCEFIHASVGDVILTETDLNNKTLDAPLLTPESMDFGYSLGVLHHVPNTQEGINNCVQLLKPGAPFLIYLYYSLDNRPAWYRFLWKLSELGRKTISNLPFFIRRRVTDIIAILIYWPLAKLAKLSEALGLSVSHFPLSAYRNCSLYTMRTDALDRFGTALEQRFSRQQIQEMLENAGLIDIKFSNNVPYWVAVGFKK